MKRLREWYQVVLKGVSWGDILRMVLLLVFGTRRGRHLTLHYLRQCWRCPVYNRKTHVCRPWDGSNLGCGCYMPMKIRFGGGCWAVETGQDNAESGGKVGWTADKPLFIRR